MTTLKELAIKLKLFQQDIDYVGNRTIEEVINNDGDKIYKLIFLMSLGRKLNIQSIISFSNNLNNITSMIGINTYDIFMLICKQELIDTINKKLKI